MRRLPIVVAVLWAGLVLGNVLILLSGVSPAGWIAGVSGMVGGTIILLTTFAHLRRQRL
jgi:hypothetical protein